MKRISRLWVIAAVILLLAGAAGAQSLAEVARKTRAEKGKRPTPKVITNDDIPTEAPISVTGQPPANGAQAATTSDANASQSTPASQKADDNKTSAQKRDEAIEQWKKRFADQKNKISLLQREFDVLQGEYRLRAAAYYADAGNAMRNQAAWAKQDRDYRDKLDLKQKQLEEAKQQLEEMQEAARKAGMPSSVSD